jgi:hypothetical protein
MPDQVATRREFGRQAELVGPDAVGPYFLTVMGQSSVIDPVAVWATARSVSG